VIRNRCGCGLRVSGRYRRMWIGCGRRSCAGSTLNTRSGSSNRLSAGPLRSYVTRTPHAAGRWTWIVIAAYTQLRLARHLAQDLRRPWERPAPEGRLTPARVRRGFGTCARRPPDPAGAPRLTTPGPGRPPGSRNRGPATRHDVGKTTKWALSIEERNRHSGLKNKLSHASSEDVGTPVPAKRAGAPQPGN
jgi:hypothetical protein